MASAQTAAPSTGKGGIYSCVDARGRTLTGDRPIPECIDRPQRELASNGTTRRVLEPSYTPREQAEREELARRVRQENERLQEDRRRDRALLVRYPTLVVHERIRAEAVGHIDAVIEVMRGRLSELAQERRKIDGEFDMYRGSDPSHVPAPLRHRLERNVHNVLAQNRLIDEQEEEKRRINARFDAEAGRLRPLWPLSAAADVPPSGAK